MTTPVEGNIFVRLSFETSHLFHPDPYDLRFLRGKSRPSTDRAEMSIANNGKPTTVLITVV